MTAIIYERLVAEFETGLLDTLRSHGASQEGLETWVPDTDPVKSILNMAEAARGAGLPGLAVSVGLASLPAARHAELSRRLGGPERVSLSLAGETATFTIDCRREAPATVAPASPDQPAPATPTASRPADAKTREDARRPVESLRALLAGAAAPLCREGLLPPATNGLTAAGAMEDGVRFGVLVDAEAGHVIRIARHSGSGDPVERTLFDAMCRVMEGTPFQEAADHAALTALHELRAGAVVAPGVMTPASADPTFTRPTRLVRAAWASYRTTTGLQDDANEYEPPPRPTWLALGASERLQTLEHAIAVFLADVGRPAGTISLVRLEPGLTGHPVRVVVSFAADQPSAAKPGLIRTLERFLRQTLEPRFQLLHEPLRDKSTLRRL